MDRGTTGATPTFMLALFEDLSARLRRVVVGLKFVRRTDLPSKTLHNLSGELQARFTL